jgi:hypothetical protein
MDNEVVPSGGVEPPRLATLDPESSLSASFSTRAINSIKIISANERNKDNEINSFGVYLLPNESSKKASHC